jgi:YhcH/YjgK/YiaL family protein
MILDRIENAGLYHGISENFKLAFETITSLDLDKLEPGKRYEIKGDEVHFNVQEVDCKAPDDDYYEAHVEYADIQYILDGTEYMGWANLHTLTQREAYKPDIAWYRGKGTMLRLDKGDFVVFFPEDAHMPCRNDGVNPCRSLKLVVKVKL